MSDELMLDVGQANEIKLAARRAGATNADLKRLSQGDVFAQILPVLRGLGEVIITKYIVDLDADPFVPSDWKVVEHTRGGKLEFDPRKVQLYLDEEQQAGRLIVGNKLREKLKGKTVFNANLLEFYLKNPHLIPDEWKGKAVFFWGTIYRDSLGNLCVRCLYWNDSSWDWRYRWLDDRFHDRSPAAISASI